ncbi:hypothetical protein [Streptomyces sp. NPDC058297]|uniref:hypothetical protein n=1 Tax=Streptomyces sp. NPDC058297 TaxID=3346433 RepID=UPI0036E489E7
MSGHDPDVVVDAELVDDRLPAIPEDRTPAVRPADDDPDAWLSSEAQEDVQAGIPEETTKAYQGDMARFAEWCTTVGRRALPAAPQTVTEYLSYLKRTPRPRTGRPYGPKTMDRIIASIRSSHRAAGYQPPDTMGARKVVAGYREELALAKDPAATTRKATPADREVLRLALADNDHPQGALFLRMDRWGYLAPPMQRDGKPIGDPDGRMTIEAASDIVQRSIERTGLPGRWRSHSSRRGFVKSARKAGVDITQIGRHGGWDDKSKALIGYVDEEDAEGDNNPLAQIGRAAMEDEE